MIPETNQWAKQLELFLPYAKYFDKSKAYSLSGGLTNYSPDSLPELLREYRGSITSSINYSLNTFSRIIEHNNIYLDEPYPFVIQYDCQSDDYRSVIPGLRDTIVASIEAIKERLATPPN